MSPEEFAHEHGARLLRLAYMLTGGRGDAEDLVQETYIRLLKDWSRLDGAGSPHAYARRTLLNAHVSGRRKARREVVVPLVPEREAPTTTAGGADTDTSWAWLATLPRQQRAVLVLRYYEDLDDTDIASLLDITAGAVRTHASRGLATLRERVPARKDAS